MQEDVAQIGFSSAIEAFIHVVEHILPDFREADSYGMAVGELVQRGDLVAHCVGCRGLGDIDGAASVVGTEHDIGSCFIIIFENVLTPVSHDEFDGLAAVVVAFLRAVDAPPRLYALAEGVEHGAFLLIEGKGLENLRLQNGYVGQNGIVSDGLFGTFVVHHGVVSGLGAGSCSGRNGNEREF